MNDRSRAIPTSSAAAPRGAPRALWWTAACFLLLAAGLFAWSQNESAFMARLEQRLVGREQLTDEQKLVRFVDFAARNIRHPRFDELPGPGVQLYYWLSPFHPGPSDVIRYGADYRGPCGSHSRVVISLLKAAGVRARPLLILDDDEQSIHTVVQAYIDGRWVVSDALFGIVFRTRDGRLATAKDMAADTATFWRQTRAAQWYPARYDYDHVTLMNWQKVPVVLPAIRCMAEWAFGRERVAEYERPSIWMRPRMSMALLSTLVAASFALAAFVTQRRRRRD